MEDILIIDDDAGFREVTSLILEEKGYRVRGVSSTEEAYAVLIAGEKFDLILCDLCMPFTNNPDRQVHYKYSHEVGFRTARELASVLPESRVIVLTSLPPSTVSRLEEHLYPVQAFSKPTTAKDLLSLLDEAAVVQ